MMERAAEKYFVEYSYILKDNGVFPNSHLPVLLYKNVLDLPLLFAANYVVALFEKNHWNSSWKSGVYTYHHYHSNTHEVIGAYKGKTTLLLGGENGITIDFEKGDVIIIPAGVAHKNLGEENAVSCVGAYPRGHVYDMNTGKPEEYLIAKRTISLVPMPDRDPVLGLKGGVENYWKK